MDNGMGVGLTMSVTAAGIKTSIGFDTGMGTVGLGLGQDGADDINDSNPACFSLVNCWNVAFSGKGGGTGIYSDGDAESGNSIAYKNSMGGVNFHITRGMESTVNDAVMTVVDKYHEEEIYNNLKTKGFVDVAATVSKAPKFFDNCLYMFNAQAYSPRLLWLLDSSSSMSFISLLSKLVRSLFLFFTDIRMSSS